jgi:hypothetical protein
MTSNGHPSSLTPSPIASAIYDIMREHDDVKREILTETIDARNDGQILESGRTFCDNPRSIRGPLRRFPRAVDLQKCPVGGGGAWHTHVTPNELRSPTNSLPDMSYVVFDGLEVMGVVGTNSAEYLLAADDKAAMRAEFSDAIGETVESPQDVIDAIESGRVSPTPARRRAKERLSPLIKNERTGFSGLSVQGRGTQESLMAAQPYEHVEMALHASELDYGQIMANPGGMNLMASEIGEQIEEMFATQVPGDITGTAVGATVGTVVGTIVERIVFGE